MTEAEFFERCRLGGVDLAKAVAAEFHGLVEVNPQHNGVMCCWKETGEGLLVSPPNYEPGKTPGYPALSSIVDYLMACAPAAGCA